MTIPALPSLDRTSATFKTDLDALFLTQLPATTAAINGEITRIDGILPAGYVATSTTSLSVPGSGTVTLTVQANKGFAAGQFVSVSVTADPAVQMGGTVTAYDYTTGVLSVGVSQSAGSGTYAAWTVAMTTASASPYSVGDLLLTNRTLTAPAWLPANGGIYSQASYAGLYTELGLLRDGAMQPWATGAVLGAGTFSPDTCAPLVHNGTLYAYSWAGSTSTHKLNRTTDGATITGTASLTNTAAASAYLGVAAIGTTMLALPPSGNAWVSRSTDTGGTFASQAVSGMTGQDRIMVIGSLFCIFAYYSTSYWTSPDGAVWTARTLPVALIEIKTGNGIAVGTGSSASATSYTTADGITWTARTMPSSATWSALNAHYNATSGVWLMYGTASGVWARSADNGATWSAVTMFAGVSVAPASAAIFNATVRVLNGRFFVYTFLSSGSAVLSSADGATWTANDSPPFDDAGGDSYTAMWVLGSELYLCNGYNVWQTSDGTMWRRMSSVQYQHQVTYWRYVYEVGGVQVAVYIGGDNTLRRRPVYTYNSATQFAVPNVTAPAPSGVTAYIKA